MFPEILGLSPAPALQLETPVPQSLQLRVEGTLASSLKPAVGLTKDTGGVLLGLRLEGMNAPGPLGFWGLGRLGLCQRGPAKASAIPGIQSQKSVDIVGAAFLLCASRRLQSYNRRLYYW